MAGFGVEVLEQALQGPDQRVTDALGRRGGWRRVNGVAATQPAMMMTIEAAKTQKPVQE